MRLPISSDQNSGFQTRTIYFQSGCVRPYGSMMLHRYYTELIVHSGPALPLYNLLAASLSTKEILIKDNRGREKKRKERKKIYIFIYREKRDWGRKNRYRGREKEKERERDEDKMSKWERERDREKNKRDNKLPKIWTNKSKQTKFPIDFQQLFSYS